MHPMLLPRRAGKTVRWLQDCDHQSGASMVEVLVALVVVAIGVLGAAGLFLLSNRGTVDASFRTAAAQAASEMADRVRLNPGGAATYNVNAVIDTSVAIATDCYSVACTPVQQANFDRLVWAKSLVDNARTEPDRSHYARIPGARAVVCMDSTPNDGSPSAPACDLRANAPWVVKIWWQGRAMTAAEGSGEITRSFMMSFLP
ncbi:type IV pilus modification protein PilV [Niveibacterium sp.]|uniref:type IV pilus modification protein PilV n=1 Tax=Niveibacterium sp. TaxID=2017444 RepID=UPI0035ADB3C1